MDDSLKDVLTRHWQTLVRYINPTASLISVLVDDKILPSAMIDDIKKGATIQEKNEILLKSIKMRGNTSYRKFRDAMMKCGQIFIADLLFEEDSNKVNFVEESDVTCVPSLKLSLNPEEIRQLVITLNARVKSRVLRSEWRRDSQQRMDVLQARSEEYRAVESLHCSAAEHEQQIKQMTAELNVKNDIIRSLSLEINVLNQEVLTFTQTYQLKPSPRTQRATDNNSPNQLSSRFRFFDHSLMAINQRLNVILGDVSSEKPDERVRMDTLEEKTVQVLQLVRELEAKVMNMQRDRDDAIQMLLPGRKISSIPMVHAVQRFQMQEQKYRYSLLKDIDRLSRKLRGMTVPKPTSGLFALRQSAVTGMPSPGMVDFRFLSNHISLLEADAEHLQKKLTWKDSELKTLKEELATGKTRPRDSSGGRDFEHSAND
ncbi:hypothetical protein BsWGS_07700 [Bradybaena similaris]